MFDSGGCVPSASRCDHCPGSHTGELPCLASATVKARSWLLIEHPGPWPERIERLTGPAPVAAAVARALAAGVRPQLIRRPGRAGRRSVPPLQVYVGSSMPGGPVWLEGRRLSTLAELDKLDEDMLAAVAAGRRPEFGEPLSDEEPVVLVCTHARRNVCCARHGAPLARALSARFGSLVWETTHVGGDRYAANLVCLPHGLYYGALGAAEAEAAVTAYLRGELTLERLRGRAGLPEPAQAAEHFVRSRTGELGVNAVSVESLTGTSPYEAVIDVSGARYRAIIERVEAAHECGSDCSQNNGSWVVRGITLLNPAALV